MRHRLSGKLLLLGKFDNFIQQGLVLLVYPLAFSASCSAFCVSASSSSGFIARLVIGLQPYSPFGIELRLAMKQFLHIHAAVHSQHLAGDVAGSIAG
jgi:hypothetical protein